MFLTQQGGILGPFAWIFGKILDFMYNFLADGNGVANLGICIILFTIVVKLILLPMNVHTSKTSKINTLIQPEIKKIQKKYENRKDEASMMKQQQELQAVYDKYGTSMTGGCLPALIQFPIIMGLYRVIQNIPAYVGKIKDLFTPIAQAIMDKQGSNAQQYIIDFVEKNEITSNSYAMSTFEKLEEVGVNNIIDTLSNMGVSDLTKLIEDIGMKDALISNVDKINEIYSFALGINISEAPGYHISWALLIPISSVIFNYLSMKVSMSKTGQSGDATADNMMKSMMFTMPLMSLFIGISLPAGIGIYWAVGAFISVIIQIGMNFYYDRVDMDKIIEKQVAKAEKKKAKRGGKKSFMQRMLDSSEEAQKELEKQQAMKKNAASSLKSYVPSEKAQKAANNKNGKTYKKGSIGANANIMMNYNNREEK